MLLVRATLLSLLISFWTITLYEIVPPRSLAISLIQVVGILFLLLYFSLFLTFVRSTNYDRNLELKTIRTFSQFR